MDEKEKLKLERTYSEMPDSELIEMLLVNQSEYEKEMYDLVSAEARKRGLKTKINEIKEKRKDKDRNNHRFWSTWGWLLWWRIQEGKLERQVEQYDTLKITQSARGISFLLLIFSCFVTLVFIVFFNLGTTAFFDIFLFFVLGFFIYKGYQWAIVVAMIVWTFEKFFSIYERISTAGNSSIFISQIIWWSLYMHAFYVALKVERLRKKQSLTN